MDSQGYLYLRVKSKLVKMCEKWDDKMFKNYDKVREVTWQDLRQVWF